MDWKAISNNVLVVGLFVAMVTMFNQVNARIDALNDRIDGMQTEAKPTVRHHAGRIQLAV